MTTTQQCCENGMQQSDVITMCPPSSFSPSISPNSHLSFPLSFTFCNISSSNRHHVLSRLPSQSPKYKPRDPASIGCLLASYLSIKERSLIRLKDHQPLGRMTHKETQTNIYLLHKQPLFLFNYGPPESPGHNPLLLGKNC